MNKTLLRASNITFAEFLFTILPILILILILFFRGKYFEIYFNKDWSFVSIICFGQSIIKLNCGTLSTCKKIDNTKMYLVNALIIALGLVPSIIIYSVLSIMSAAPTYTYHAQALFVIFGTITFFVVARTGQFYIEESFLDKKDKNEGCKI